MCLFVSVFFEVYGLYLNKTVGSEWSILLCVCVFVLLSLRGPSLNFLCEGILPFKEVVLGRQSD